MTNTKNTKSTKSTKSTKNTRFENKQTVLKGEFINLDSAERTPFEITVPYVRSEKLALEAAYNALELNENFIIDSRKFEIINKKAVPVRYSNTKLFEYKRSELFVDEENAKKAASENETVKSVSIYTVISQVWSVTNDGEYNTYTVAYYTPFNITKSDARAFVKMRFEKEYDEQCIGLHNTYKTDATFFVVIGVDDLKKCIIEKKHDA